MEQMIIQLICATLGTFAFSMVFHLRKEFLGWAALGGFLSWAVYLLMLHGAEKNTFISCLVSAICVAFYGEIMARKLRGPATVFIIPGVLPLIPGSGLFYTMSYAVSADWDLAQHYGFLTIQFALGIAIGISLVMGIFSMARNVSDNHKALMRKKQKTE